MTIGRTEDYQDWMYQLYGLDKPLTSYHLPSLLAAEAGRLKYEPSRYRINGVCNNAANLADAGLLTHGHDGMVLTAAGRERLARARAEQPDHPLLRPAEGDDDEPAVAPAARQRRRHRRPVPVASGQLDLLPDLTQGADRG